MASSSLLSSSSFVATLGDSLASLVGWKFELVGKNGILTGAGEVAAVVAA